MNSFNRQREEIESYLNNQINKEYPILFNRINWDIIDTNINEIIQFQKTHTDTIPPLLLEDEKINKKITPHIPNNKTNTEKLKLKNTKKSLSYDNMYEFIQKYPEFSKYLYYEETPNGLYDKYLTIQYENYPITFNRINWQYVDEVIDKLYELTCNEKRPVIPPILFIFRNTIKQMSENYQNTAYKIYEYYNKEQYNNNRHFKFWAYYEYDINKQWIERNDYDTMYEFIQKYPEFSNVVYFDYSKI